MIIEFVTKNYSAAEKLKDIIKKKVDRLDKYFHDDTKIKVMMKANGDIHTLELTILLDGIVLRSEVSSGNMYENIDQGLPKLEKQIVKHRKKLTDRSKKISLKELEQSFVPEIHESSDKGLVRSKTFHLKPMSVEDAIAELELIGHSFYVFLNNETDSVNVVYKRRDGAYGLIETVT